MNAKYHRQLTNVTKFEEMIDEAYKTKLHKCIITDDRIIIHVSISFIDTLSQSFLFSTLYVHHRPINKYSDDYLNNLVRKIINKSDDQ